MRNILIGSLEETNSHNKVLSGIANVSSSTDCVFYADDSQLYITIDPLDQRATLNTRQKCIGEVIRRNTINKLMCNPSKTEIIQFSFRFVKNPILSDFLIFVSPQQIVFSTQMTLNST